MFSNFGSVEVTPVPLEPAVVASFSQASNYQFRAVRWWLDEILKILRKIPLR